MVEQCFWGCAVKIRLLIEGKYDEEKKKRPLEGNGNLSASDTIALRGAFREFLTQAGIDLNSIDIVMRGGTAEVYKTFVEDFGKHKTDASQHILMLADSDMPLQEFPLRTEADGRSVYDYWKVVLEHPSNVKPKPLPIGATPEHIFLMVAEMEGWIVADVSNLIAHFKMAEPPPLLEDIENQPKEDVKSYLNKLAQAKTRKNYHKILDGAALLQTTSPENAHKLSQCARLFNELERLSAL